MELSKAFLEAYRANEAERQRQLAAIEDKFNGAEADFIDNEVLRLTGHGLHVVTATRFPLDVDDQDSSNIHDFRRGDRVWCSRFKCMGTITEFKVVIDCWDHEFYDPSRIATPRILVLARVQPDPTSKGKEREMIETATLQLEVHGTSWYLPQVGEVWCWRRAAD